MEDDINLYKILRDIYERRFVFISVFMVTFVVLTIYLFTRPKKYMATATFFFPIRKGGAGLALLSSIGGENLSGLLGGGQSDLSDYAVAILESRTVTDYMIKKFGPKVFKNMEKYPMVKLRRKWSGVVKIELTGDRLIEVRATTTDPKLSADIANEYINAYRRFAENSVLTFAKQKRLYIEKQRDKVKQELEKLETKMLVFQNKHQVLDIPEETKMLLSYYAEMQSMTTVSEAEGLAAQTRVNTLRQKLIEQAKKADANFSYPLVSSDPSVKSLYVRLIDAQTDLIRLKKTYTDNHPDVKKKKDEIAALESSLRSKIQARLHALKTSTVGELIDAETLALASQAKTKAFERVLKEIKNRMKDMPELGLEYGRLYRDVEVKSKVLAFMEMELEKARLEEAQESTNVQVLDKAVPPDFKTSPNYRLSLIFIFIISLTLATISVFIPKFLEEQKKLIVDRS